MEMLRLIYDMMTFLVYKGAGAEFQKSSEDGSFPDNVFD